MPQYIPLIINQQILKYLQINTQNRTKQNVRKLQLENCLSVTKQTLVEPTKRGLCLGQTINTASEQKLCLV